MVQETCRHWSSTCWYIFYYGTQVPSATVLLGIHTIPYRLRFDFRKVDLTLTVTHMHALFSFRVDFLSLCSAETRRVQRRRGTTRESVRRVPQVRRNSFEETSR